MIIKWTKTLQDNKSHHVIQVLNIENISLCPVRVLQAYLRCRSFPQTFPLFANSTYPLQQVIDTHICSALKQVLIFSPQTLWLPHIYTFAFDSHDTTCLWHSLAVWIYLYNTSQAPSIIPTTFATHIPFNFWLGFGDNFLKFNLFMF